MTHRQVYIKVNAEVDGGIAPLVQALNEIEGVITVDSCENGAWGGYVFFTYGEGWKELASLLQATSSLLCGLNLPCGFSLVMEWLGGNDKPRAQIAFEPEHVAYIADGIQRIAASLNARMSASTGDK